MYSSKPQEYDHMLNENVCWIFILATSIYAGVNSLLKTEFSIVIGNPIISVFTDYSTVSDPSINLMINITVKIQHVTNITVLKIHT